MKVLIRQATIISSSSPYNGQVKDILIEDGIIRSIADAINEKADQEIKSDNLHVSIGFMDTFAQFGEPGLEHKETLVSGAAAAAAGGFTDVMIIPNTQPVIASRSQVEYITQRSANLPVSVHPIGAITKDAAGKELTEMYDMHAGGAKAFSDGKNSIQSPGLLLKALQYVNAVGGTIIQLPGDNWIGSNGLMHEGIVSTQLGLPGKPAIAEELMIARDIELLKYTQSRLHITGVSTKRGLELIAQAKKEGLNITCSVTPYHCCFSDKDLEQYDTNLKVNPPLRTMSDVDALKKAVLAGEVDCFASHHLPEHWDDKTCEFEYAKNGMIGLESLFGAINSCVNDLNKIIDMLTIVPRQIFNIPVPVIREGEPACLTVFNPGETYTFEKSMIRSASQNSAFIGKELKGRIKGIINKNIVVLN